MLLQIALAIFSIVISAFYFTYIVPKRKIEKFARYAESLGYKVKLVPFQFMQYYMASFQQQNNRSLSRFKEQMPQYDLIVGNMFGTLALIPVNLDMLKDFYNNLAKLPKNSFISQVFQVYLSGGGIVFTEGDAWKRKRRIISSVFHFDFINDTIPIIQEQINFHLKQIDQAIEQNKTVDIQVLAVKIFSSVIAKCFFGTNLDENLIQGKVYSDYFLAYLEEVNGFTMSPQHAFLGMLGPKYGLTKRCRQITRKLKILREVAKQIIFKEIEKIKRKEITQKNLLTTLLQHGHLTFDQNNNPDQFSVEQLISEFFIFVGAGTDTSSHTINLILHYMSDYPNLVQKVREQTQKLDTIKELSLSQRLKRMQWADSIFNEVLRINGPISQIIPRISSDQLKLGKLEIPKGTCFNVLPLINHYNNENFADPQQFKPERWMDDPKVKPYSYTPFAAGERNCMGHYLARIEAKLILSQIIKRYQFKSKHAIQMKKMFFFVTQFSEFEVKNREKSGDLIG